MADMAPHLISHGSNPSQISKVLSSGQNQRTPGRFNLLYQSRDGKLCIFEDEGGHLTAVRSSRLV